MRGINSSSCAYVRPYKVVLLYMHNKVRAVMRAAAFSRMYTRSRRTSGNSILKKKQTIFLIISATDDQKDHDPGSP